MFVAVLIFHIPYMLRMFAQNPWFIIWWMFFFFNWKLFCDTKNRRGSLYINCQHVSMAIFFSKSYGIRNMHDKQIYCLFTIFHTYTQKHTSTRQTTKYNRELIPKEKKLIPPSKPRRERSIYINEVAIPPAACQLN